MVSIRDELREYGLFPKKSLGQHFLVDRNILDKVIRTAQVGKEDVVLEVGPGLGEMTLVLAHQAKQVIAVEIDRKLVEILKKKLADCPNVDVLRGDILTTDFWKNDFRGGQKIKVVANLPYQISTPLLFHFIDLKEFFSTLTLMLQKEVAERMVAISGSKSYGPLSIFIQMFANVTICFYIKPSSFFPPPKVDSAVVHMTFREKPLVKLENEKWFRKVVKGCFGYRRKMLINALKHSGLAVPIDLDESLEKIGIDSRRRSETLTIQEFVKLAEALRA
jgi:16S rRNA (adenine1518-N6/adenine1519-N6)-dimethyltransferase